MNRTDVLREAEKQIMGKREQDYGTPEDNFDLISGYWTLYKGIPFSRHDVAMMMALLKVARIQNGGGSGDSYVDMCGYAALASEMKDWPSMRQKLNSPTDCNTCDLKSGCGEKLSAPTDEDWLKGEMSYVPGLDCPRKKGM